MKGIKFILFAPIFLIGLISASATLEEINEKCPKVFNLLDKDYQAALKEYKDESLGKSKGFFSRIASKLFNGRRSESKILAQEDLNELSQLYAALNVADVAALHLLKRLCESNPEKDPNLCNVYPKILSKQVQNRLGVINSCIVHSVGSILTTPSRWLNHVITATELMNQIDVKNSPEYRAQAAVISAMSPQQYEEFMKGPNIFNSGKRVTEDASIALSNQETNSKSTSLSQEEKEEVNNIPDTVSKEEPKSAPDTSNKEAIISTNSSVSSDLKDSQLSTNPTSAQSNTNDTPSSAFTRSEQSNSVGLNPKVSINNGTDDNTDAGGNKLVVHVQL